MRILSILAVGATFTAAAPLSVVVSSAEVSAWRIGRPAVGMSRIALPGPAQPPSRMGRFCNKMQSGVARLFAITGLGPVVPDSNAFSMATPHAPPHHPAHPPSSKNQMSMPSIPIWQKAGMERLGHDYERLAPEEGAPVARPHGHHHHHNFRPYHRHHGSFLRRVHRALMSLGPWEGRAVAFVLGCGIGVLLRMVWVITVLSCRAIRGTTNEHDEDEVQVEFEQVAVLLPEEIFIAPPEYTDEKVDRAELDDKA